MHLGDPEWYRGKVFAHLWPGAKATKLAVYFR